MAYLVKNTRHLRNKCIEFANRQILSSADYYSKRAPAALDAIIQNITTGKLAEYSAYKLLLKMGYNASKPDLSIHETYAKNYNADITTKCGLNIHVKSQTTTSRDRYGDSWVFQLNDPVTFIPNDNDYICLVSVGSTFSVVMAIVPAKLLVNQYKTMRLNSYAVTKHALYWKDIKSIAQKHNISKSIVNNDLY